MSTDQDKTLIGLGMLIPVLWLTHIIWRGFVISMLWLWFAVPIGAPTITAPIAAGLSLMTGIDLAIPAPDGKWSGLQPYVMWTIILATGAALHLAGQP